MGHAEEVSVLSATSETVSGLNVVARVVLSEPDDQGRVFFMDVHTSLVYEFEKKAELLEAIIDGKKYQKLKENVVRIVDVTEKKFMIRLESKVRDRTVVKEIKSHLEKAKKEFIGELEVKLDEARTNVIEGLKEFA